MSLHELNNSLVTIIIMEEEDEEELLMFLNSTERNKAVDDMFSRRATEGAYNVTVERRLFGNEQHFRAYFRLSTELFQTVLSYVREDITKKPYNRRQHPISPEEKLCITLR